MDSYVSKRYEQNQWHMIIMRFLKDSMLSYNIILDLNHTDSLNGKF